MDLGNRAFLHLSAFALELLLSPDLTYGKAFQSFQRNTERKTSHTKARKS